jgi:tRNA dimethylallyltransferase
MDIGTAKPDAATRARIPHHLLDIVDPTQAYSAARFVEDALSAIATIRARQRLAIVAGGTMLYFRALTEGLSALPSADPALRAQIDAEARVRGWPTMHAELARVDAATAARLDPGDAQRIQRALEVFRSTGAPLSTLQGKRTPRLGDVIALALLPDDRARLHKAIASRFDAMLAAGLVDELAALRSRYRLAPMLPSMRAVGYRQAWQFLEGEIDREGLRMAGIAATRQLAKRQITWLRTTQATRFDPFGPGVAGAILAAVERAL